MQEIDQKNESYIDNSFSEAPAVWFDKKGSQELRKSFRISELHRELYQSIDSSSIQNKFVATIKSKCNHKTFEYKLHPI